MLADGTLDASRRRRGATAPPDRAEKVERAFAATWSRSRTRNGSTATCSMRCATWSGNPGSASAAPSSRLQLPRGGVQRGARRRRAAVDEAGQCAGDQPVRRLRGRGGDWTTRVIAPSSASVRSRCTPIRCSAIPRWRRRFVVAELSPYEVDLDWVSFSEPDEVAAAVDLLGRATAKIHCASDEDSEQDLVDFQVEEAIAESVDAAAVTSSADHLVRPRVRRTVRARPRALRRRLP